MNKLNNVFVRKLKVFVVKFLEHFYGNLLCFEALKSLENPAEIKQCPEIYICTPQTYILKKKSMRILQQSQKVLPLNCHTLNIKNVIQFIFIRCSIENILPFFAPEIKIKSHKFQKRNQREEKKIYF